MFSSGLIGIESIHAAITDSKSEKIEKIEHGESIILLESGDEPISYLSYALLVKKEMISIRYFLKSVKKRFQDIYKNLLINLEKFRNDYELVFSSFDYDIFALLER